MKQGGQSCEHKMATENKMSVVRSIPAKLRKPATSSTPTSKPAPAKRELFPEPKPTASPRCHVTSPRPVVRTRDSACKSKPGVVSSSSVDTKQVRDRPPPNRRPPASAASASQQHHHLQYQQKQHTRSSAPGSACRIDPDHSSHPSHIGHAPNREQRCGEEMRRVFVNSEASRPSVDKEEFGFRYAGDSMRGCVKEGAQVTRRDKTRTSSSPPPSPLATGASTPAPTATPTSSPCIKNHPYSVDQMMNTCTPVISMLEELSVKSMSLGGGMCKNKMSAAGILELLPSQTLTSSFEKCTASRSPLATALSRHQRNKNSRMVDSTPTLIDKEAVHFKNTDARRRHRTGAPTTTPSDHRSKTNTTTTTTTTTTATTTAGSYKTVQKTPGTQVYAPTAKTSIGSDSSCERGKADGASPRGRCLDERLSLLINEKDDHSQQINFTKDNIGGAANPGKWQQNANNSTNNKVIFVGNNKVIYLSLT